MTGTTPFFVWRGFTDTQKRQSGLVAAASAEHARIALHRQGIRVRSLQRYRGCWHAQETLSLTRQLGSLLGTGIPLAQALSILIRSTREKTLPHWVLEQALAHVRSGSPLHQALRKIRISVPRAFDDLYLQLVEVGEASASLAQMLERLANGLERKQRFQSALRTASVYPLAVLTVSVLLLSVFMTVVVPSFAQLYAGKPLPDLTQTVLAFSAWMRHTGWWLLVLIVCGVFVLWQFVRRNTHWQIRWQKTLLRVSVLGPLLQKSAQARCLQTVAMLLQAGVPLQAALELAAGSADNRIYEAQVLATARRIGLGQTLAKSLDGQWFGEDLRQMVAMGEESANLGQMLERAARLYMVEVAEAQKRLGKLAEPMMVVFLGLVIGTVVLALYLPIFQIGQVL